MKAPTKLPVEQADFRVNIKYQPVYDLKTVTASGAMANLTPDRLINLVFFTERRSYPISTYVNVTKTSSKEADDEYESGNGESLVREINQSIIVDESTARFLLETLEDALGHIEKARDISKKAPTK